jgi:hypothetical protein
MPNVLMPSGVFIRYNLNTFFITLFVNTKIQSVSNLFCNILSALCNMLTKYRTVTLNVSKYDKKPPNLLFSLRATKEIPLKFNDYNCG